MKGKKGGKVAKGLPSFDDLPEEERNAFLTKHEEWLKEVSKKTMKITVSEPIKEGNRLKPYITYLVSTLPAGWGVRRRYSDIEWVLYALIQRYPAVLFESMPPKKVVNNTESEFVEVRMKGLERFLNKLAINPYIRSDNLLLDFLKLSQSEWDLLKKDNTNTFNLMDLTKPQNIFNNMTSLIKKNPKKVEDDRKNEGLYRWHEYLRHLTAPQNIDPELRAFSGKVDETVNILTKCVETVKQMVVRGSSYAMITDQLQQDLKTYFTIGKDSNVKSLRVEDGVVNAHKEFVDTLNELQKVTNNWHQLEFFNPQEIIPELQYELQDQLDHVLALQDLFSRRKALAEQFKEVWTQKDNKDFEVMKLKQKRQKDKARKAAEQVKMLEKQTHMIRYELININKAIVHCELKKFVEYRNKNFRKTMGVFARLQTALAVRSELTWIEFLNNIHEESDDKSMKEARIRLANACDFFEYIASDDEEGSDDSDSDSDNEDKKDKKDSSNKDNKEGGESGKKDGSDKSDSESEGGVDPSEYDL